jgi:hypothetical protein
MINDGGQALESERCYAGCRKFYGEGHSVELAANVDGRGHIGITQLEAAENIGCSLDE